MRIGALSRETGASVRSLRHYEQQGLIRARRGANGYREFGPEAIEAVRRVKALLALGLNVETIRDLLPCEDGRLGDCSGLATRLSELKERHANQAAALVRASEAIEGYLAANFV